MDNKDRVQRLRNTLGLTQRQCAEEFKVTHGAIALWESGERLVPGPVLRLLEIYEEELGLIEPQAPTPIEFDALLTSRLRRGLAVSKLSVSVANAALIAAVRSLFLGQPGSNSLKKSVYLNIAAKLSKEMGEMKGLPMKLGQALGYVNFAMPEDVRRLFSELHTTSPSLPAKKVADIITSELGAPPREVFAKWTDKRLAAASIGQVHLAKLKSGERAAVKIQYPGIKEAIESDLDNFNTLNFVARYLFKEQNPGDLKRELRERFLEECDFEKEAEAQEFFRKIHAQNPQVVVPRVFKTYCTSRVLAMEYVPALSFTEFITKASNEEKRLAGEIIWQFTFESILSHGVFNADPHPGNYLFEDNRVVFLDFGCVRHFSPGFICIWKDIIRGVLERDSAKIFSGLVASGMLKSVAPIDKDHMLRLIYSVYQPILSDEPFTFTDEYLNQTFTYWFVKNPNAAEMYMAREWIFLTRAIWGTAAILRSLGAAANWRRKMIPLVYDTTTPEPLLPVSGRARP